MASSDSYSPVYSGLTRGYATSGGGILRPGVGPTSTGAEHSRPVKLQICDAPLQAPATIEARRHEARTDRRLPGAGELPVGELLRHLPRDIPLAVAAPSAALSGLPFVEHARKAGEALRNFLADPRR